MGLVTGSKCPVLLWSLGFHSASLLLDAALQQPQVFKEPSGTRRMYETQVKRVQISAYLFTTIVSQ